ncbi:glycosyltransferase [Spirosoma panaciterrae]|uniref:glycosyltransferase n=1 Tax=Spirosoma panaciterrae TaxID=496058 RepID=UPI000360A53A|nr:glycosyltransferase [Spirosoma panaciterrae]
MKVLFVSSGNKKDGISPIILNQGEAIRREGVDIDYFTVAGKGWWGYISHWLPLINVLRHNQYDLIHAHYSLCGFLATLAAPTGIPIIVSLMGTFRKNTGKYYLVRFLAKYRWQEVIVKSERMRGQIGLFTAHLIPNGVEIEKFNLPLSRVQLREELGLAKDRKIVIFVSDPERIEKNFPLCRASIDAINRSDIDLIPVFNKPHEEVVKYMLAANVLMLTSLSEGSPNVIKEAMAANCPIVCTNVGDVAYLLSGLKGAFISTKFDENELSTLVERALLINNTEGLKRIKYLQIDSISIAKKIVGLYKNNIQ